MIDFIPYETTATSWPFHSRRQALRHLTLRDKDYLIQDLCSRITTMYYRIQKDDHVCGNVLWPDS
jgi:hypothetical protein